MGPQLLICVIPTIAPYIEYIKIRVEKDSDNANLCENNVRQIFELIFLIVKGNCLPTYLEREYTFLKSLSKLSPSVNISVLTVP